MNEVEIVGAPIDGRIDVCQPRFTENKVVFLKVIDDRVQVVGIVVASEGDWCGVRCNGGRAIGKDYRNGLT